ncbi:FAD/NADP-binding domain-containing protein [Dacryopinax primogenitus]|uniref:FAD/NADP-binding domain-containing protein n=1 Tax=Dacryopinax primogenitus (strain DJM 731) TaxID=1858805 RepID=M5FZQ3_DACPD|nr:FAD/NADP-binding domain-containing protein [Dacryopinax primogenitus]EJU01989.1 FAD/NADP-binding domain-containing protein [Dacryopinax primogenitus]
MKVLIIGAGIAGPVLAMVLKHKGFEPVIYERYASVPAGGLALALSAQSFKVLNIIGLADEAVELGVQTDGFVQRSEITGQILQERSGRQPILRGQTGWPMTVTLRSKYCDFIVKKAEQRSIPIHWSKKLVDVKQDDDKVIAVFEDGTTDEGDLLVGCDGLHSKVRDALFGKTPAEYTGVVVIGGWTPYTNELHPTGQLTSLSVFGRGCHFFSSPTAEKYFWAVTMPAEAEMLEDWRMAGKLQIGDALASVPATTWSGDTGRIISGSDEVIRFGLYLRPIPPRLA